MAQKAPVRIGAAAVGRRICDAPWLIGVAPLAYHLITALPRSVVPDHDPPAPVRWQGAQPVSVHTCVGAAARRGARRRDAARGGWCAEACAHPRLPRTTARRARAAASAGS